MVTSLYAGLLALLYVALTLHVVSGRIKNRISLGDAGNINMETRIRIHGNFIEYVPIALILLFFAEFEGMAEPVLHALGITLVLGRLIHMGSLLGFLSFLPMSRPAGMVLTLITVIVAALYCIKAYFAL